MIFDTHAHYDDEKFEKNPEEILKKAQEKGVSLIMNVSADLESMEESIQLAEKYDFIYSSVGIHPHYVDKLPNNYLDIIGKNLRHPKVKAIGEIGLDYFYTTEYKEKQKEVFIRQLKLAKKENLPVIIHTRDAQEDTLSILKEYKPQGVVHCFSGSKEFAQELNKLNLYVSFTGVITFKNAKKSIEALQEIPLTRLLIETDCPYMAPEPVRGTVNHSGNLIYIVEKIAQITGKSYDDILKITMENGKRLFNID